VPPPEVDRATAAKHDPPLPGGLGAYVLAQLALLTVGTTAFLVAAPGLPSLARVLFASTLVLGLASLGGLLDRRRWALGLETVRLAATALVLPRAPVGPRVVAAGVGILALSALWLLWRSRRTPGPGRAAQPTS